MSWGADGAWPPRSGISNARSNSRWGFEAWCGGPMHWAEALVTNLLRLNPTGKERLEHWVQSWPGTQGALIPCTPLPTSPRGCESWGRESHGLSSRKACLGGRWPPSTPPGAGRCSFEGGDGNLKSSGKDRQHWAASLSSKRSFMSVSEFGLYSWLQWAARAGRGELGRAQ